MPVNIGAVRVPQNGGRVLVAATGLSQNVDSGVQMMDAMGYSRFVFQLLGTFTGFTATFYGTNDPALYAYYLANIGTWQGSTTAIPTTSWFTLPAPAEQTGTGTSVNPLTSAGQLLEVRTPIMAVRCVLTSSGTGTGTCTAIGTAYA